ncbi:response regulator [Paenibacillus sp. GCM10027626]|uniref:response regulator n=1 Tax=Paenibacillus sp. GCM10027626 TaxID=3273411 RepID=UPI0036404E45
MMDGDAIKVIIVEDDAEWRRGLKAYLNREADICVAAETDRPDEALALIEKVDPDVVLLDIMLADEPGGLKLTAELPALTGAKIVMLTSMEDREFVVEAFRAGAANYIVKSDFAAIPEAVRTAAAERSQIDGSAARLMLEEFRRLKAVEREYEKDKFKRMVTPSEVKLLEMIHEGYSQSEIAEKSFLSLRTVKNHVSNILRKLGGKSSKEAAKQAKDMGLF